MHFISLLQDSFSDLFIFSDIVKKLVNAGANKEKKDRLGKTPLLLACQNANLARENYPIIQFLLEKGCDPFSVDKNQNSCIQLLCKAPPYKTNHILAVKKLLEVMEISPEKTKENLNSPSNKCDHVLGIMASNWKETNEEIEILELFVKAGADPHKRCAIESKTLHMVQQNFFS